MATTKRAQVSFEGEVLDNWRKMSKELRIPVSTLSEICNEAIRSTTKTIERMKEKKGRFAYVDLFAMIGEGLDQQIEKEVKGNDEKEASKGKVKKNPGKDA